MMLHVRRSYFGCTLLLCSALSMPVQAQCTVGYVPLDKRLLEQQQVSYLTIRASTETNTAHKLKDMAAQLQAAQWLYPTIFGIDAPMSASRYRLVERVEALVMPMHQAGLAYDETVRATPNTESAVCVLRMKVADNLSAHNVTPAHELFHLFQSGLTMFKQPWITEGTARWAESAFLNKAPSERPLPQNAAELLAITKSSYGAGLFWNRLTRLVDPIGRLNPPDEIASLTYSDGSPVLPATRMHGRAFIGALFRALGEVDREISTQSEKSPYQWTENEQKNQIHNAALWRAIQGVAASFAATDAASPELDRFLAIQLPIVEHARP